MKPVILLVAAALTACTTTTKQQQPAKFDMSQPVFKRYSASKSDLLYGFWMTEKTGDTYPKAAADADKWCSQYQMVAVERAYPACQEYVYPDGVSVRHCNVAFKCQ